MKKGLKMYFTGILSIIVFWGVGAFISSSNNKKFAFCLYGFLITFSAYCLIVPLYLRYKYFLPFKREIDIKANLYANGKLSEEENIKNEKNYKLINIVWVIVMTIVLVLQIIRFLTR